MDHRLTPRREEKGEKGEMAKPNDGHTHDTNGPETPIEDGKGNVVYYNQSCSQCGITTGTRNA